MRKQVDAAVYALLRERSLRLIDPLDVWAVVRRRRGKPLVVRVGSGCKRTANSQLQLIMNGLAHERESAPRGAA